MLMIVMMLHFRNAIRFICVSHMRLIELFDYSAAEGGVMCRFICPIEYTTFGPQESLFMALLVCYFASV